MKYKIVSLLLVFVLLFMFTFQPIHKSQAVAIPLAAHFGGAAAAQAFLGWLLLMDKLGVQFNALEEAEKLYENWQLENMSEPLDPQPPEGQTPQRDWLRWVLGIATGATLVDSIGDLFGDVKSWIEGLFGTLQPGTNVKNANIVYYSAPYYYYTYKAPIYIDPNGWYEQAWIVINGHHIALNSMSEIVSIDIQSVLPYQGDIKRPRILWALQRTNGTWAYNSKTAESKPDMIEWQSNLYESTGDINISITSDAPILNPSYSPPITPIPPVLPSLPTLDSDNEKIGIVPSPDGTMQQIYEGTYEDYFKDYVENVTWDDLQNPTLPRSTIQEGTDSQGNPIIIINPSVNTPAFPNPNTDPEADTGVFQGTLIGLTQIVINWLKLIWEAITAIPQAIYNLFVPEPGYFGGQVDILKGKLLGKFDNESAINFLDGLDNIQPKPIPDLYYKENIILEADFVNDMAPYIKSWLNFFLYVGIALASMNFFYKLIRGTNAIDIHAYDNKGSR